TMMPATLRAQSFDHVMANPPYFDRRAGTSSRDPGRDIAMGEDAPLVAWVDAAVRRLKPKGTLTMIHRVERLPDMLEACDSRLGKLTLLPIAARQGQGAERVILRAEKGAKAPFRLMPPLVMHVGDRHTRDGDDYTARISAVLRNGASLEAAFSTAS
ncbi:MAG: methyltransferase, partial [Pseudomonadota bacterium]